MVGQGATNAEIQFHYDVGREFYGQWLDKTMTYSCAMFEGEDTLDDAQIRKLDHHIRSAKINPGARVLDIGCGWGSLMRRVVETIPDTRCVGLTLSEDQKRYIDETEQAEIGVELASWEQLDVDECYDAVVSIGAFEHFARPEQTESEKSEIYRNFFKTVRRVVKPEGYLSLQTIVFDRMVERDFRSFITEQIFPGYMLPRLAEIFRGADRIMSLVALRNDASDYARTCREWCRNIQAVRPAVVDLIGAKRTDEYIQYLRMSAAGFEQGAFGLLRMTFRSYPN